MSLGLGLSAWACQQGFCGAGLAAPLAKLPCPSLGDSAGRLAGNVQQEQPLLVTPARVWFGLSCIQISLNDLCFHFSRSIGRLSLVSFSM